MIGKRPLAAFLGLVFLSAFGMPLRRPCCSLYETAASLTSPDCCPTPDCCKTERRGAAPLVLTSKNPRNSPCAIAWSPAPAGPPAVPRPVFVSSRVESSHGPPPWAPRGFPVHVSILRI